MASASKITSAFGASAFALSVLMTGASAQDVSSAQTCETASLNSSSLTPPSFAQEDFVAISERLNDLGLLDSDIIGDLLETSAINGDQKKQLNDFRRALDEMTSRKYSEATGIDDYSTDHLSRFANALEKYITVLEFIYADNPEVKEALADMGEHRLALQNTNAQIATQNLYERMGIPTCTPDVIPNPGEKNYGERVPTLALS